MLRRRGGTGGTKRTYFAGCALGLLGVVCVWVADGVAPLILANLLLGAQHALCGSALLFLLMHRWHSTKARPRHPRPEAPPPLTPVRAQAFAVGVFVACLTIAELAGGVLGVLLIERPASCSRDGEPLTAAGLGRLLSQAAAKAAGARRVTADSLVSGLLKES